MLCFFFFNDTATTEIYTLSLHDALPISLQVGTHPAKLIPENIDRFRHQLRRFGGMFDWRHELSTTDRSEEHTSELQSQSNLVCRLLLEKKKHSLKDLLDTF